MVQTSGMMREYVNFIFFGIYPYIALVVFFAVSVARFNRDQYTWRSGSSQLLRKRQFSIGSNLFHIGILVLFVGHFVGLLTPIEIFHLFGISHQFKQLMSMTVGGAAGIACFAGLILLLHRRLFDVRIRRTSALSDIFVLALLLIQLILGMLTILISYQHLDGGEMVRFMTWAQMIITFQPSAAELVLDAHLLFKLHLFVGLTVFLVFPFTRLVHVWSAPIWYLGRRGYQIVRTRKS